MRILDLTQLDVGYSRKVHELHVESMAEKLGVLIIGKYREVFNN